MIYCVPDFGGQAEKGEGLVVKSLLVSGTADRARDVAHLLMLAVSSLIRVGRHTMPAYTVSASLNYFSRRHSESARNCFQV